MKTIQTLKFLFLMGCLLYATASHSKAPKKSAPIVKAEAAVPIGTTIDLAIVGFNYTDRDINVFSVDGAGGGNLSVSSASGWGGGSACCAPFTTGDPAPEISVRWQSDACTYKTRFDKAGTEFNDIYSFYTTKRVNVSSISPNPKYLEVHIFPDGRVEAAITGELSGP